MTVRVLVADDQQMVRAGFRLILSAESDLEVVGEAADGEAAVGLARQLRPDVVLMDIRMPGLDGLQATRRLLHDAPPGTTRVLMLTTFDTEEYVFGALKAGASGFLLKNSPPEQLIEAIRVVAGGDALLAPSVTRLVIEELARRPPSTTSAPEPPAALTEREREVLLLVAQGLTNAEIAARIYVSEATVKTHVSRVLMKLGLRDRVHAVIFAYEKGLVGGDG
jgi:DNA-binding NarL/FixJ family response regulator